MNIYVLKILFDINNNYNGIDDVEVHCFTTLEKAQEEMKKKYAEYKNIFIEEYGCEEGDFEENNIDELSFIVGDCSDYYSGKIEKLEIK